MRRLALMVVVVLVLVCLTNPGAVSAEWFGDLYVGGAFTQNHDVTAKFTFAGISTDVTGQDLHFDSSLMGGGRFGYWFDRFPWLGLGLDVSHFEPNIGTQTANFTVNGVSGGSGQADKVGLSVTDIAFDLMLRWPGLVASEQFPKGRLQPYLSVGPAIFIATAKDSDNFGVPDNQSSTNTSLGVQVGTGVTWLLTPNIGIFGEYRFTHFSPQFGFDVATPGFSKTTVETDVNTHHVLFGVSIRF
jgi:opacity protein-like surface antigen